MQTGKTLSILGCGWLGLPLGNYLAQLKYTVKGSTTTPAKIDLLTQNNIQPFIFNLADEASLAYLPSFLDTDILIIAFPPGIRAGNGENYLLQIKVLAQYISKSPVKHILFISSSSVYPELNKTVTEAEDLSSYLADNPLLQAEQIIYSTRPNHTTIVRFAGLVGGTRLPGRFFAGKTDVPNPNSPVNLIHLNDCIGLLTEIIKQEKWSKIYNGCADEHPTREEFYTAAAKAINLTPPLFAPSKESDSYKIISNEKVKKDLHYLFIHPNPLQFI